MIGKCRLLLCRHVCVALALSERLRQPPRPLWRSGRQTQAAVREAGSLRVPGSFLPADTVSGRPPLRPRCPKRLILCVPVVQRVGVEGTAQHGRWQACSRGMALGSRPAGLTGRAQGPVRGAGRPDRPRPRVLLRRIRERVRVLQVRVRAVVHGRLPTPSQLTDPGRHGLTPAGTLTGLSPCGSRCGGAVMPRPGQGAAVHCCRLGDSQQLSTP